MIRLLLFLLMAMPVVGAHSVTLAWDYNAEQVDGYRLYAGLSSGSYHLTNDVGFTNSGTFVGLVGGPWYFAATAYRSTLESGYSSEVSWNYVDTPTGITVLNSRTNSVQLLIQANRSFRVQRSSDLISWEDAIIGAEDFLHITLTINLVNPKRFYRIVYL